MKNRSDLIHFLVSSLLVFLFLFFSVNSIFARPEWWDIISYGLAPANWIQHGIFSLPQLGSQFQFDQYWLFNAPIIGAGAVPFYYLFGVSRLSYLLGIFVFALINWIIVITIVRKIFPADRLTLILLICFSFLGHRLYFSELYNQRYSVIHFAVMILAFAPLRSLKLYKHPWWKSASAGVLPLIHPVFFPAYFAWFAERIYKIYKQKKIEDKIGSVLFLGLGALTLFWYGRINPLKVQLIPHITFGNFRNLPLFVGMFFSDYHLKSLPSWCISFFIILSAFFILTNYMTKDRAEWKKEYILPSSLVLFAFFLDSTRGFNYLPYYVLPLGVILLSYYQQIQELGVADGPNSEHSWVDLQWNNKFISVSGIQKFLVFLGFLSTIVSLKFDHFLPTWVGQKETRQFILEHTQANDHIVLGPPFVLVASEQKLFQGRVIERVVPQPYFLENFDETAFLSDIQLHCNVYLGQKEWFERIVFKNDAKNTKVLSKIFPQGHLEESTFLGQPIWIVRAH